MKPGERLKPLPARHPPVAVRPAPYPSAVKVLGIDPGTAACGYGIVHVRGGRVTALASGCWTTGARERPELRLRVIFEGVQALIAAHAPDAVAIEESYVGADARIALSVGQARGAVMVAAATAGVECTEYAPTRVKQSVCGHGHADKGQVQRMVKMLLSLPGDPADLARGRRPRRRDLPRADAAARADGIVIARLRGTPAGRSADGLVLDVNGVGYLIAATPGVLSRAEGGGEISVETFLHVREDALQLYGFVDAGERQLFVQLLTVSGVGPKVALAVVSGSPAPELRRAIAMEDHARFQAIPGIGKRTAERIVLELKEKVSLTADDAAAYAAEETPTHLVARDALVELGYTVLEAEQRLQDVDPELPPAERVRLALRAG